MTIKQILMAHGAYVGEEVDTSTQEYRYLIRYPNGKVCAHSPYVAGAYAEWLERR